MSDNCILTYFCLNSVVRRLRNTNLNPHRKQTWLFTEDSAGRCPRRGFVASRRGSCAGEEDSSRGRFPLSRSALFRTPEKKR